MGWFRTRSRLGSYLTLFALAFQLAVSFGHVHLDEIAPPSAGAAAFASTQSDVDAPSGPTGREDVADDCCPICTLIHLAGALVPTNTPALSLPRGFGQWRLRLAAESYLTVLHGALFQARAPPVA
jgi:hypothetical protein